MSDHELCHGDCGCPEFTCDACGITYKIEPGWDAEVEAAEAFTPEELEDQAVVCDDCWHAMRRDIPELDARYPGGDAQ